MTREAINIGIVANDGTGDSFRVAGQKINNNFVELYTSFDATELFDYISIDGNNISATRSNDNINIIPAGTGVVTMPSLSIDGSINFVDNVISAVGNSDINFIPNGTGSVVLGDISVRHNTVTTNTSNADLQLSANSTGSISFLSDTTVNGNLSTATVSQGTGEFDTSLTLATGATVTGIDNGALGSSATLLATQGAIKTYIDAQNTSQALTFVGDDSTGTAVNSGETFQIAGGTGLTSAVSGDTLTLNIDSTVATLTGTQILTNKTLTAPVMTGNVAIDNIIINDSEISTSSNAVLTLNPGGTGTIALSANTDVTGTLSSSALLTVSAGGADITGTLITDDVTTTGNVTISGSLGLGSLNIGDLNITPEGKITTDTNGDVDVVPSGTGAINLTGPTNVTGVATVTGQLNTDNLRLDGNTISATSGGITLQAAAGQNIQAGSLFIASEINVTTGEFTTLRTDALQNDTSNGDLSISTQGTGTVDFETPSQTTVGAGAGGSALPGDPVGYLKFKLNGTEIVVPYWNAS